MTNAGTNIEQVIRHKEMQEDVDALTKLAFYSSTKLANFLYYTTNLLATNAEARIIVFSQFGEFLKQISDVLDANYIPNVFVKGYVRSP